MPEELVPDRSLTAPRGRYAQARSAMRQAKFHSLVIGAIEALPLEFRKRLENLDVVVTDWPSPSQLAHTNAKSRLGLLGLYEGVPHTKRGRGYDMVLPDKITVFRKPIEARCHSWKEIEEEVGRVVRHEIAHHFGTDEQRLRKIEGNSS
ncbi:MAG: metallopeptidase family protein [Dehalococcoidia bacterium]